MISERLRLANIGITFDIYNYVSLGLQQAAANRFDNIVIHKNDGLDEELKEIVG